MNAEILNRLEGSFVPDAASRIAEGLAAGLSEAPCAEVLEHLVKATTLLAVRPGKK